MTLRSLLPRSLELNVMLGQRLGWKSITWTKHRETIFIVGIPPGREVTESLPNWTSNPSLYFDLAHTYGLCVTRPLDKWVVVGQTYLEVDPFLDNLPSTAMVVDPGERIVELTLEELNKLFPQF